MASHALRCALLLLPGTPLCIPLTDTADMGLAAAWSALGGVKSVGRRVAPGSGVLASSGLGS